MYGCILSSTIYRKEEYENVCKECRAGTRGCVACKKQLAQNIIKTLEPIREKRKYYEEHPELVDKILIEGTQKLEKKRKKQWKSEESNEIRLFRLTEIICWVKKRLKVRSKKDNMFTDYVKIYASAGKGGNGAVSFRRENI